MTRSSRIPTAAATLAFALLAGCDSAMGPTGVEGDPNSNVNLEPMLSVTASGPRCETIDFEEYVHGASIDGAAALSVFASNLSVSSQRWNANSGGSLVSHPAKAFDTDSNVPAEDADLRDDALCPACEPLDVIIVIEDVLGFATDGDSRWGGEITITGFGALSGLTLESVTFVDTDLDEDPHYVMVDGATVATATPTGNGAVETVSGLGASLSNTIKLVLPQGTSGGFDNLEICQAGGGEGCTPGYWKQPHHFDSWPAAYNTTDTFGSVFTDCGAGDNLNRPESGSICGKTLLQALKLRGGGLNALGRHAVAALLSSSTVSYDLTPGQVIDAVNDALSSNSYGSAKNMLADFNEQNCPLN